MITRPYCRVASAICPDVQTLAVKRFSFPYHDAVLEDCLRMEASAISGRLVSMALF